jgi:micrococcal nuclease
MNRLLPILALYVLAGCDHRPANPPTVPTATPVISTTADRPDVAYRVVGVVDGDTIDLLTADKQTVRIRLNGIDAPERGQPFGNNARQLVSDLCFGRDVQIIDHGSDKYGRTIADVLVDGQSINLRLVQEGLAWHYKKYSSDEQLATAERIARESRIGLWSDPRHVAPWDWRDLSKAERDKLR